MLFYLVTFLVVVSNAVENKGDGSSVGAGGDASGGKDTTTTRSATGGDGGSSGGDGTVTTTFRPGFRETLANDKMSKICKFYYKRDGSTDMGTNDGETCRTTQDCADKFKAICYKAFQTQSSGGVAITTSCSGKTVKDLFPDVTKADYICGCPRCTTSDSTVIDDRESKSEEIVCCKFKNSDNTFSYKPAKKVDCSREGTETVKDNCKTTTTDGQNTDICATIYKPVCDRSNNEYSNDCERRKANVADADVVPCRDECNCEKVEPKPICVTINDGTNTKTTTMDECKFKCTIAADGITGTKKDEGVCNEDKKCIIDDSVVKPVCDTSTSTSYGNLRLCQCEGKCATSGSYTDGRCSSETSCKCAEYISRMKPFCRTSGSVKQTIYKRCAAICSGIISVDSVSGAISAADGSTIEDGKICSVDENNCLVRQDPRAKGCDESADAPTNTPRITLQFKIKLCYLDRLTRKMFFTNLRTAVSRVLYNQCSLTKEDTDKILIVKYEPDVTTMKTGTETKTCTANDGIVIKIAVYTSTLVRAKKIRDCISSFKGVGQDIRAVVAKRFKEVCDRLDSDTTCTDCSDESALTCDKMSAKCDLCKTCTRTDGSTDGTTGIGDASIDTTTAAAMTVEGADGSVDSSTVLNSPTDSSGIVRSVLAVFVMVLVSMLFN